MPNGQKACLEHAQSGMPVPLWHEPSQCIGLLYFSAYSQAHTWILHSNIFHNNFLYHGHRGATSIIINNFSVFPIYAHTY